MNMKGVDNMSKLVNTKNTYMDVMLTLENKQEAEEVMEFLDLLNNNEKKDFLTFMRGAYFTKILGKVV